MKKHIFKSFFLQFINIVLIFLFPLSCNKNPTDSATGNDSYGLDTKFTYELHEGSNVTSVSFKIDDHYFNWWFETDQDSNIYFKYDAYFKYHPAGANCIIIEAKQEIGIEKLGGSVSRNYLPFYLPMGQSNSIDTGGGHIIVRELDYPPFAVSIQYTIIGEFVVDSSSIDSYGEFEFNASREITIPSF